jgi:ABC-type multidrug transport system fused ATPase/permease subunit
MSVSFARHHRFLRAYLRAERREMALLAFLLLLGIVSQLLSPQVIRVFIDDAQAGGGDSVLLQLGGAFLVLAVIQKAASIAAGYVGSRIAWSATNRVREDLTRRCLSLSMSFHAAHPPGEMIERIDGDVTLLSNYFSRFVLQVIGNGLLVAGILCFVFVANPLAGAALTIYTVVVVAILRAVGSVGVARMRIARQASAEQYGYIEERLTGTEDIRSNGAEEAVLYRLFGALYATRRSTRSAKLAAGFLYLGANLGYLLGFSTGLVLAIELFTRHDISLGTAYALVYYVGMLSGPIDQLQRQAQDLQRAMAGISRVETLLTLEPAVPQRGRASLPSGQLDVDFDRVTFGYHETIPILRAVDFHLPAGAVLGIVGRTGSGKTTISRLVARLYDPWSGSVRIGGVDLRDMDADELRHAVAVVPQDVQLFAGTVRDNLTFFDRSIDDAALLDALQALGLQGWLNRLPYWLDSQLQPGGSDLSAGEAQLLACARVFIRDPRVVVLDEASSRLDPRTERIVGRAISRLFAGRTTIVIAHRLQTIELADYVLVLESGAIAEYGPRAALATDPRSHFASLLRAGMEATAR